jgi:hypothetical protein
MRALVLALLAVLAYAATATAHPAGPAVAGETLYQWGEQNSPTFSAAMRNVPAPQMEKGPCTDEAARSMPANEGHDHTDISQHRFKCRMEQVAFRSLVEETRARPDITFGEMDVKGDLAVVAVAYPETGFFLFDVSNSADPKFLSWYRGEACEAASDVDCGAFVDLSPDGKRVYISVQSTTIVAQPQLGTLPASYPGVEVVDISDRTNPKLLDATPVQSVGGVHTARSFLAGDGQEYTVSVANSVGAAFHRVSPTGKLIPVGQIKMDELHDTFIQKDPLTGKILLYIAGGFDSGFYVYDVTDPVNPEPLAEWDITPECAQDWYSHTIDVTTVNGRRIVTMPVELIDFFGDQTAADQAQGCGKFRGNGDFAGPLFIVDATDFSKMGAADPMDSNAEEEASDMKQKSEATLITTWSNAANRAGGRLVFSPHNQQIVGDRIYLSGYHAGVTVLDASAAFAGRNVRPKEIGVIVPHGDATRPIQPFFTPDSPEDSFFTSFLQFRPTVWDMQWHDGHVLAADMVGGFYALRLDESNAGSDGGGTAAASGTAAGSSPAATPPQRPATPRRCASRRALRVTLKDPKGRERITSVRVTIDGKRASTLRGKRLGRTKVKRQARFRVPVVLRGRRAGRSTVVITARTSRGRTIRLTRRYRTCTALNRLP